MQPCKDCIKTEIDLARLCMLIFYQPTAPWTKDAQPERLFSLCTQLK